MKSLLGWGLHHHHVAVGKDVAEVSAGVGSAYFCISWLLCHYGLMFLLGMAAGLPLWVDAPAGHGRGLAGFP